MNKTKIEWADTTWSPVTGCRHGCDYCYARRIAQRFCRFRHEGYRKLCPGNCEMCSNIQAEPAFAYDGPFPFGFSPTLADRDLVSRDAVVELLDGWKPPNGGSTLYGAGYNAALLDAIRAIQNQHVLPAADAEPVRHGEWIGYSCTHYAGTDDLGEPIYKPHTEYRCKRCRRATVIRENYCPNCGAKMDGGEEAGCRKS